MKMFSRVCAEIDLDAIEANYQAMRGKTRPETQMIAVVKADGYGHGAVPIAKMLESHDYIWGFGVATAEEALELREHKIQKPILILGYVFEEDYERMAKARVRLAVFKADMAEAMSTAAGKAGQEIAVHLVVDTGMTRIGFSDTKKSISEIHKISKLPGLHIEGMFTHFAKADEADKSHARSQILRYIRFLNWVEKTGVEISLKHCSNSAGILEIPEANMDLVRPGITGYGIYPSCDVSKDSIALKPAMSLKSHIVFVKDVEAGVSVSYGGTFVTDRKSRIATIPVGYGDGYPRSLSNKGWVLIHGKKAPILGRICMDQFMVDVTDIPEAEELDEAVLMGESKGNFLGIEELSQLSGRFPYEFVCDIGKRIPRVYYKAGERLVTEECFNE